MQYSADASSLRGAYSAAACRPIDLIVIPADVVCNWKLTERALSLMDIAPYPSRGRDSAHDGMLRLMEMFGRVLACRGIATADMAARSALAKSNPNGSFG